MRFDRIALAGALIAALALPALAWEEPKRGSQLRKDLMNTIRPLAEDALSAPVQFVVEDLRVNAARDRVFAGLQPQRPGGKPILWEETNLARRGDDPMAFSGSALHALLHRDGAG
ncbi:MAG: hypothetical protein AAFR17_19700 [Pseudomonadota bacterium]